MYICSTIIQCLCFCKNPSVHIGFQTKERERKILAFYTHTQNKFNQIYVNFFLAAVFMYILCPFVCLHVIYNDTNESIINNKIIINDHHNIQTSFESIGHLSCYCCMTGWLVSSISKWITFGLSTFEKAMNFFFVVVVWSMQPVKRHWWWWWWYRSCLMVD